MKSHTFTDEDYNKFGLCVDKWVEKLGITGWKAEVVHEHIGNGTAADINYNIEAQKAYIRLTETVEYDYVLTDDVEELAKHEVLHLLLATMLYEAAHSGDSCAVSVVAQEHNVINRLLVVLK